MNVVVSAAGIFGALAVGNAGIFTAATYAECSKTDLTASIKNGAIAAAPPAIIFFIASFFEVVRSPFVNFFLGWGVEPNMAVNLGLGYMVLLLLWPMTVWAVHKTSKEACVASADEMTAFKTQLLAKLQKKQQAEAAKTKPRT